MATPKQINMAFCLLAVDDSVVHDFRRLDLLGRGHFGSVSLCELMRDTSYGQRNDLVAIKDYRNRICELNAKKEALVLNRLDHRNIVKYLDNYEHRGKTFIVMEFCNSGTLEDYIYRSPLPEEEYNVWRFTWQMLGALTYLHTRHPQVVHADLKPANILCNKNADWTMDVKIADFGVCCVLDGQNGGIGQARVVNKVCYSAPETLRNRNDVTPPADIWSLGAIISYITNNAQHLFYNSSEVLNWTGDESPVRWSYSRDLKELVLSMLNPDKDSRPSAGSIDISQDRQMDN